MERNGTPTQGRSNNLIPVGEGRDERAPPKVAFRSGERAFLSSYVVNLNPFAERNATMNERLPKSPFAPAKGRSRFRRYDANGNRDTTGYTVGTGNELTNSPGVTYTTSVICSRLRRRAARRHTHTTTKISDQITYDPFGNIVTQTNATDAGTETGARLGHGNGGTETGGTETGARLARKRGRD
jgi:hypothetical protein